jgi:tetratricopeptide (TPR) repeat protein
MFDPADRLFKEGKFEQALMEYRGLEEQAGEEEQAALLMRVGNCQHKLGEFSAAVGSLRLALERLQKGGPPRELVLFNLGNSLRRAGQREQAVQAYE